VKEPRHRLEVNLEELDRVLDGARQAPLSDQDHHKLREAMHAMAAMLVRPRTTEKTSSVVRKPEDAASASGKQPDGVPFDAEIAEQPVDGFTRVGDLVIAGSAICLVYPAVRPVRLSYPQELVASAPRGGQG
jgi:hypothetical protein